MFYVIYFPVHFIKLILLHGKVIKSLMSTFTLFFFPCNASGKCCSFSSESILLCRVERLHYIWLLDTAIGQSVRSYFAM